MIVILKLTMRLKVGNSVTFSFSLERPSRSRCAYNIFWSPFFFLKDGLGHNSLRSRPENTDEISICQVLLGEYDSLRLRCYFIPSIAEYLRKC
jgi:hypothetical protein